MKRILLLVIISILISPVYYFNPEIVLAAPSTAYYVANDGDNSNDGLSPATPWQTIGKVNTEMNGGVIGVGDDVYFNRGDTFTDAVLYPRLGGNSSDWMTIGAYGSGAKPIFSTMAIGIDQPVGSLGYIIIQDLDLQPTTIGIRWRAGGNTNNITFLRIDVDGTSSTGIIIDDTDHYRIENCHVTNAVGGGIAVYGGDSPGTYPARNGVMLNCTADGDADSIVYHERNNNNMQVGANHYVYNCTGYNAANEDGFDITSGSNIYIKDCESYGNGNRAMGCGHDVTSVFIDNFYAHDENRGLLIPSGHDITTRYSTVEDIEGGSAYMSYVSNEGTDSSTASNDIVYYNNNFIFYDGSLENRIHSGWGNVEGVTYKNNIFQSIYSSAPSTFFRIQVGSMSGNDVNFTNNLWWRGDGLTGSHWADSGGSYNWASWTALSRVYGSIRDDADFTDGAGGDYTLTDTSPCIDAGDWLTTTNGGGGPSTIITVHEANYFFPGFPTITHYDVPGDNIFIGDDTNLEVTAVDYDAETITVNRSITWSDGDDVSLSSYYGTAPDIGAYEFQSIGQLPSSPEISNVILTESDPLDTNASFGWINISAAVTSDPGVNKVMCNISLSNASNANISMGKIGSNTYYYNTSTIFSNNGSYSYYIWANDTNGNVSISSVYVFSMPPNWDINNDGQCGAIDLTFVSNHYGEIGQNGWIREDVDNNGIVQVLDFIMIAVHYGETW